MQIQRGVAVVIWRVCTSVFVKERIHEFTTLSNPKVLIADGLIEDDSVAFGGGSPFINTSLARGNEVIFLLLSSSSLHFKCSLCVKFIK